LINPFSFTQPLMICSGSCCQTLTISDGVPALNRWGMSTLVAFVDLVGIWAFRSRRALPE
jgi:hypothetical protein